MTTPKQIFDAIGDVKDQKGFVCRLLRDTLGWPIPDGLDDLGDISFKWSADELKADGLDKHLTDGRIWQIQKLHDDQPWGIFLLEFKNDNVFVKNRGLTGPLRKVLRGLVHNRRKSATLPSWNCDDLLFICTNKNYRHYRFAHFAAPKEKEKTAPLSMFGWNEGDTDIRTLCTHNLPYLVWDDQKPDFAKWRQAFDKLRLTEKFFNEYKTVFDILQNDLAKQTGDEIWAHDYALQFLNRCMFLYFIQRKKWLGDDCEFMKNFLQAYEQSGQPDDTFFENWLKVLFFEAFNNKYTVRRSYMPESIHKILLMAPYLNGGLFSENKLDKPDFDFHITDTRFRKVLDLLERYNFTVNESTPLDIEVAVDAEMLGMVYETLVNIAEDEDRRGDAGIFYTPRVEVDLMCRLSVVNYLSNRLGTQHRELFYKWLFAFSSDKERIAEKGICEKQLVKPLREALENLTVVDPACGSGAFLVGMLLVLDNLFDRLDRIEGKPRSIYSRRKEIIGRSLYGVDIKDWACHVAELRLWLALIVDADFTAADLHIRREPLLPNFTFNIRCGDSLVQEVGGLDIAHRKGLSELSATMKRKLTELKNEKIKFYNNDPDAKFKTVDKLKQQEVYIFRQLLEDRVAQIQAKLNEQLRIQQAKKESAGRQRNLLTGELEGPSKQWTLDMELREQHIAVLRDEKNQLEQLAGTLNNQSKIPFVWDISFAEIFGDDKQGFDIVIGNPPYVRQEKIADPRLRPEQITPDNKRAYKEKLQRLVYRTWDKWFGYKEATGKATRTLDAKSDLYIYFYLYGLSLLNDKGTFCFITSNSWLDVGYGADLQEFLLNCCPIRMIIDNKTMRSFKSADVNTAIALFGAPSPQPNPMVLSNIAKFVMFNVPFEQVLDDVVFTLIEAAEHRPKTDRCRIFPVRQETLLAEGCAIEEDESETPRKTQGPLLKTSKKYLGNKWGGKYLRAPDIYWTILEKGKDKLVRLGDIADVRRGITTGANEFFYLDDEKIAKWGIEEEFLKPVVVNSADCKSIIINTQDIRYKVLWIQSNNIPRFATNLKKYLDHGKKLKIDKLPSLKNRKEMWYKIPYISSKILMLRATADRPAFFYCDEDVRLDQSFYAIKHRDKKICEPIVLCAMLNSTITNYLSREILGAAGVGLGLGVKWTAVYEAKEFTVFNPEKISHNQLLAIFKKMGKRKPLPPREEFASKDRKDLDTVVFDEIGLSQGEREAVYEAVIDLVEARLKKADSF